MKWTIFKNKWFFVLFILILFFVCFPFFLKESFEKSIVLLLTLLLWFGVFFKTKNLLLSSLLFIFVVLPFNITLQLPTAVKILGTEIVLAVPYVDGIYVNYLVPTLSVLDFGVVLFIISFLFEKGLKPFLNIFTSWKNGFLLLFSYLLLQSLFQQSFLSMFTSFRFLLYLLLFLLIVEILKRRNITKYILPVSFVLIINVLIQGIIGILQFRNGSSLGLSFLGESQVVSGLMGSSFVELSGSLYLRAYGTFPHPNILAGYFLFCVLLGLTLFSRNKPISLVMIIISCFFLLFTFSRVTILIVFLVIFLFAFNKIFKIKGKIFSLTPLLLWERFILLFKGGDYSLEDRINLLKASSQIIKENFLFGTGLGNFVRSMELFVPRTQKGILLLQPVHNIFVLMFTEMGFVGFLIFLYFVFYLFWKERKKVCFLGVLIVFSFVFVGFFDHYFFSLPQGIIMSIFLFSLLYTLDYDKKDVN